MIYIVNLHTIYVDKLRNQSVTITILTPIQLHLVKAHMLSIITFSKSIAFSYTLSQNIVESIRNVLI